MNREVFTTAAVLALSLIYFVRRSREVVLDCPTLLRKLFPHQIKGRSHYLDEDTPADPATWDMTGGYSDLWRRWRNRTIFLKLCQIRVDRHGLESSEMVEMMEKVAAFTQATLVAAYWGAVRHWAPETCRSTSLHAFRLYADIADNTHVLFASDHAPLCATHLASLL